MTVYGYIFFAALLTSLLSSIFYWKFHREQMRYIIRQKGLNEQSTFFSTGGRNSILIFELGQDALKVLLMTNVMFPKLSLINNEFRVPYTDIKQVDVGQGTTTFKLNNQVSPETALFGYATGSIARPQESWTRIILTSKSTRTAFADQLKKHGVLVHDVSTSMNRALKIAGLTAIISGLFGIGLWLYTLGWFN